MANWLVKSEPSTYAIAQFERDGCAQWDGVRNYQARNFLKAMREGDAVLFYHSNSEPPAIVGLAKVVREAYPDTLQFDPSSEYFDPKATTERPIWFAPDLQFVRALERSLPLSELKGVELLSDMNLLKKGSRLSVQPVTDGEFQAIIDLAKTGA